MNIQPLINAIRYKLRYGITVEWYNFWYMALRCHQKITCLLYTSDAADE